MATTTTYVYQPAQEMLRGQLHAAPKQIVAGAHTPVPSTSWSGSRRCLKISQGSVRLFDANLENSKHTPGGPEVRVLT